MVMTERLLCLVTTMLLVSVKGSSTECVIEENSRIFVPVCDLVRLFPKIESPKIDNFRNLFRLTGTNLELIQNLDREALIANKRCDSNKLSNYNSNGQCVLILDLSGHGPIFNHLPIVVTDVNDNVPTFDRLHFSIKIPENAPSNLEIDLPQARDPDRGRNGTVTYSLQRSAATHKFLLLNPSSSGSMDSPLKLKVLQPFDREMEDEVQLTMVAQDQGHPPLSSSLIIKIEITDVNDNAPEFNQSSYRFNIAESVHQGQPIGRVLAFDRDVTSRVTILMSPSASSEIVDRFTVASDGVISTKMALEYSSNNFDFRVPIIATDGGAPTLTATTTVFVHVTDVNDHSPTIEVTSSNTNNRLLLTENCPGNTYIAKVTATDKDHGNNGVVECRLEHSLLFNLELIQNFDNKLYYKLVTAPLSSFDRETKDSHQVNIICSDKGSPPQTTSRPVTVLVKDENDNAPVFPVQYLSEKIFENQPSGTRLVTLKAVDKDIGINSQTKYRLAEENLVHFNIDSYTGVITTRCSFDRETMQTVTIRATAYDSMLPLLHSNVTIHVTILDENDNKPRFTSGLSFHVKENSEGLLGRVEAVDDDEGRNQEVEYFLVTPSDTFQVTRSGEILVTRKTLLDRERTDHYSLEVAARDRGVRPQTSSTTVEIVVDDVNDVRPSFLLPRPGDQANISMATPPDTKVYTAEAVDHDLGANGRITYSIRPHGVFVINASDGVISLNRTLSSDTDLPSKLIIYAMDGGTPSLTGMSTLILNYVHAGMVKPPVQDAKPEPRTSTSRDFILSLGIGMVLLIFAFLMMLVTYFCVTILIQKRRQQTDPVADKEGDAAESRHPHWLCVCLSRHNDKGKQHRVLDKGRGVNIDGTLDRDQHYQMCLNRWDKARDDDPLYSYREFTMKPLRPPGDSPVIYDRLSTLQPQSANPYWQYNTLGHMSSCHRPSYPPDHTSEHRPIPDMIYHHGMTYVPKMAHPDLVVHSSSSDEVNRIVYGDLSPSSGVQSNLKMALFSQQNYENEKLRYDGEQNHFSSVEMLAQQPQSDGDNQSTARFAGYVVGSPCYANSFV